MYGKLENGILTYAPRSVILGDRRIINPDTETLTELGYMEIVYTESPITEEGFHAEASWEVQDGKIVRVWEVVADEPIPSEPSLKDRVQTLETDVTETKEALDMILSGVTE